MNDLLALSIVGAMLICTMALLVADVALRAPK